MGLCGAGTAVPSGTSTYHMLINGKIRRNVPGTSAVLGITGLAAFRKVLQLTKWSEKTARAHVSLAADKQAGVSPGSASCPHAVWSAGVSGLSGKAGSRSLAAHEPGGLPQPFSIEPKDPDVTQSRM